MNRLAISHASYGTVISLRKFSTYVGRVCLFQCVLRHQLYFSAVPPYIIIINRDECRASLTRSSDHKLPFAFIFTPNNNTQYLF